MSLVTAGTDCTLSQHFCDVAVNCFIARDWQLQSFVTKGAVGPGNDACLALCRSVHFSSEMEREQSEQSDSGLP